MIKKKACGILFFIAFAAALLSTHGCGMYYKADIAGYVKDSATAYALF